MKLASYFFFLKSHSIKFPSLEFFKILFDLLNPNERGDHQLAPEANLVRERPMVMVRVLYAPSQTGEKQAREREREGPAAGLYEPLLR